MSLTGQNKTSYQPNLSIIRSSFIDSHYLSQRVDLLSSCISPLCKRVITTDTTPNQTKPYLAFLGINLVKWRLLLSSPTALFTQYQRDHTHTHTHKHSSSGIPLATVLADSTSQSNCGRHNTSETD